MGVVAIKLFALAAAVLLVVFSAAQAFRNSRRLGDGIREFKKEQEELRASGKVMDPYQALAELYADPPPKERDRSTKDRRADR